MEVAGTLEERKVNVEVCLGRDDKDTWWTVLMVNGDDALWRGPYEDQLAAEKRDWSWPQPFNILMTIPSGASPIRACQLSTRRRSAAPPTAIGARFAFRLAPRHSVSGLSFAPLSSEVRFSNL